MKHHKYHYHPQVKAAKLHGRAQATLDLVLALRCWPCSPLGCMVALMMDDTIEAQTKAPQAARGVMVDVR